MADWKLAIEATAGCFAFLWGATVLDVLRSIAKSLAAPAPKSDPQLRRILDRLEMMSCELRDVEAAVRGEPKRDANAWFSGLSAEAAKHDTGSQLPE